MPTDDYTDALPPLPEIPDTDSVPSSVAVQGRFRHSAIRHVPLHYCSAHSMDSSPDSGERPISYGSTSSSASSRDSHCSLGSRSTLSPSSHCHPASDRNLDSGAIRLELVPARQLGCGDEEERKDCGTETGREMVKHGSAQTPQSDTEAGERCTPGPRMQYVDRVVQEILDTESTYVQDLRSIVQDYLECISNQSRLALSSEDRGSLFGNIRDIYHFNRDLLNDLEKCNSDPVAIAECFVSKTQVTMMCLGLQSCKLVVWTPSEPINVDIPFDKDYTDAHVQQLQKFYFLHMLPRLADDLAEKKIHLCPQYLELFK